MDEILQFNKSLQERLADYVELFGNSKSRTCTEIKQEWAFYLELAMDPCGWQAVWKVSRGICEELNLPYPSIILVYVSVIDFTELSAVIKVLAVQEDVYINEEHYVPLTQLWPTQKQDASSALNIEATAKALDMYRFFYTNICFAWDPEDGDSDENWLESHLESRLRLFYDLKNGVIPRYMAEHIRTLLNTSRRIQAKRELLEADLFHNEVSEENVDDVRVQTLMELNVSMIEIKNEIKLLEHPMTRGVILKRNKQPEKTVSKGKQFWLVIDEGSLNSYFEFLNKVKEHYPEGNFKSSNSLTNTLENMGSKDTVLLWKKLYTIQSCSGLECGGTLKGVFEKESTTISTQNDNIMLDLQGQSVLIENLTLDATFSQCGILIRAGKTTLKNCLLLGDTNSSTVHQGIIVLSGGELEMLGCEIRGFYTALVGNSGAKISMENCTVSEAHFGTKIYDSCNFRATNCKFYRCKEYAFCVETSSKKDSKCCGDFKLLEIMPDIKCDHMTGENNSKGDVLINPVAKIIPKEDLYSDPKLDPINRKTKSFYEVMTEDQQNSDEEMEEPFDGNETVIATESNVPVAIPETPQVP